MSLIEVLIVVAIMALVAGGAALGLGATGQARIRSASMRLASMARFAYHRAVASGNTVRLVLDLDGHRVGLDEAEGVVTIQGPIRGDDGSARSAKKAWADAVRDLDSTLVPAEDRDPFSPLVGKDGQPMQRFQMDVLKKSVRIAQLIVPHEPEPRTSGTVHVYFFPGGQTEQAVISLAYGEDRELHVELHPLTARAIIHREAFVPPYAQGDWSGEDVQEVEDPQ